MAKKKGLGRGLEHLLDQNLIEKEVAAGNLQVEEVSIKDISPNPYQPRKFFDEVALEELSNSIKEQGVFQPILLNKAVIGFNIISGERRYRASKMAGLKTVPCIIYDYTDQQMMEVGLVENIQREDLSIVEEAKSFDMIINNLNYTQQDLADKIGKSRSHVTNILRLLKFDDSILSLLESKELTMGQVKPLLKIEDKKLQLEMANKIKSQNLSARAVEKLVADMLNGPKKESKPKKENKKSTPRNKRLEQTIREKVGFPVSITGEETGTIEFKFKSSDELESILDILNLIDDED